MASHHAKGGLARAAVLSSEQRSEIARTGAIKRWQKAREEPPAKDDPITQAFKRLDSAWRSVARAEKKLSEALAIIEKLQEPPAT